MTTVPAPAPLTRRIAGIDLAVRQTAVPAWTHAAAPGDAAASHAPPLARPNAEWDAAARAALDNASRAVWFLARAGGERALQHLPTTIELGVEDPRSAPTGAWADEDGVRFGGRQGDDHRPQVRSFAHAADVGTHELAHVLALRATAGVPRDHSWRTFSEGFADSIALAATRWDPRLGETATVDREPIRVLGATSDATRAQLALYHAGTKPTDGYAAGQHVVDAFQRAAKQLGGDAATRVWLEAVGEMPALHAASPARRDALGTFVAATLARARETLDERAADQLAEAWTDAGLTR